jgi:Caspase domain
MPLLLYPFLHWTNMYKALLMCNSVFSEDPSELPRLHGPRRDGLILWSALTDPIRGYFCPDDVEVLFEGSRQEMADATERFFAEASTSDTLLLYYSGHGRRPRSGLILCCRDTIISRPLATGLTSDALNKMITQSPARVIIVILDCCYSGAFKGEQELQDAFAGKGRFVIAATSASEEAKDAEERGAASPFTTALVDGLRGAAASTGDELTMQDIAEYVEGDVADLHPRPHEKFDGTGKIFIAHIADDTRTQALGPVRPTSTPTLPTAPQTASSDGLSLTGTSHWLENLNARHMLRSRNDFSVGDLRAYRLYSIVSIAIVTFGVISAAQLNSAFSNTYGGAGFNGISPVCVAAVIVGFVMTLVATAEWIVTRRTLKNYSSRRALLTDYSTGSIYVVQLVRDACAIGAAAIVAYGMTRQYEDNLYVALLSCLAVLAFTSAAGRLRFGDAAYAAGTVLVLAALFCRVSSNDFGMLISYNVTGLLLLACVILMGYFWLMRFPARSMMLAALSCAIPIAPDFAAAGGGPIAPIVATVGACICLISVLSGDGIQIDPDGPLPIYPGLLNRLTAGILRPNTSGSPSADQH